MSDEDDNKTEEQRNSKYERVSNGFIDEDGFVTSRSGTRFGVNPATINVKLLPKSKRLIIREYFKMVEKKMFGKKVDEEYFDELQSEILSWENIEGISR